MLRLLLVEDEENLRLSMRDMIDWPAMGVESVAIAESGTQALSMLDDASPQVVLSDINMPGMTGLEMGRQMLARRPDLRLIFFSAYSDIDYLQQALRMGSVDYLLKPLREDELADAIARAEDSLSSLQRLKSSTDLLETYGDRLAPPVLSKLLIGQGEKDKLAEQLSALGIEEGTSCVAAFFLTGLTTPDEALLRSCLRRVSALSAERGMLLPLSKALWAYLALLPEAPPEGFAQDIVRQLTLHLQLAEQLAAHVQALPVANALIDLYGAGAQRISEMGDAQRSGQARDAMRAGQICQAIQSHITAHYAERDLSASSIARALHYTSAYICTIFKAQRDMTIHDFINLYRIARAKELLIETTQNIAVIAQATGYENDNYFARVFRKLEGMSPSDYRRGQKP